MTSFGISLLRKLSPCRDNLSQTLKKHELLIVHVEGPLDHILAFIKVTLNRFQYIILPMLESMLQETTHKFLLSTSDK